jgi:TP901 family phage tail tape measure protein
MTPWRTMSVALQASTAGYVSGLTAASAATKKFGSDAERSFDKADRAAQRSENRWRSFGKVVAGGLAVVGLALGFSVREAISWESAWAGVTKTVEGTSAQLNALEDDLLDMANRLPASRGEIAGVAEAAGQLGVATEDVSRFTETMIALGVSTNLSADEAATGLARFMNIMGTAAGDVERLGATLVDLGNKGASTEAEILQMATRMAGGGRLIGLTEANVLALSNALSSIGVQAELGSGVMTRFFTKLYTAAKSGDLEAWASAARMSMEDFTRLLNTDSAAAIDALVTGMAKTSAEGGNLVAIFDSLGLKGTLNTQVLSALVSGQDVLTKSLQDGNEAWSEGSALADEAAKRYATAESQLRIFGNKVTDVARQVGAQLIPMLLGALDAAERFGQWLGRVGLDAARRLEGAWDSLEGAGRNLLDILDTLWRNVDDLVVGFAQLGGATLIAGVTALADALESVTGYLADNEEAVRAVAAAIIALSIMKAWPLIISAIETMQIRWLYFQGAITGSAIIQGLQGIAGGFTLLATNASAGFASIRAGLATVATSAAVTTAAIGVAAFGLLTAMNAFDKAERQARAAIDLEFPKPDPTDLQGLYKYEQALTNLYFRATEGPDASGWEKFRDGVKGTAEVLTPMEDSIVRAYKDTEEAEKAADEAAAAYAALEQAYVGVWESVKGKKISLDFDGVEGERFKSLEWVERWVQKLDLDPTKLTVQEMATAIEEASNAAEHGTPATDQLAGSWAVLADETSNATDQLKAWREQIDAIIGIQKSLYDATTSYGAAVDALNASIKENGASFDPSTEKGRANRDALSSQIDAAIELSAALAEQNGSIEDGTTALALYREQIIQNLEKMGLSRQAAEDQVDALGLTQGALDDLVIDAASATGKVDDLNNALARTPDGKTVNLRVTAQWDQAAKELAFVLASSGLGSTGQVFGGGGQRWGGITHYAAGGLTKYASGGLSRQAQVGSGRNLVWWDEPETGGEAYVPKRGNRARSTAVLQEAAGWYGLMVVPTSGLGMAAGGIMGAAHSPPPIYAPSAPAPNITVIVDGGGGGGIGANYGGIHISGASGTGKSLLEQIGVRG